MKNVIFCIFLVIFNLNFFAQNLNHSWTIGIGGIQKESSVSAITDLQYNVFLVGNFHNTIHQDSKNQNMNISSNGGTDIFITKYDENGNLLWAKSIGGIGYDFCNSIAIDSENNLYLIGYFEGTVDFDPSANTNYKSSTSYQDLFVLKLSNEGNFIWVKTVGNEFNNKAISSKIKIDNQNNIFIAGYFYGTVDFDPSSSGIETVTSGGSSDSFILKLDNQGNLIWVKNFLGIQNGLDRIYSLEFDNNQNIILVGSFEGDVDFDPGINTSILSSYSNNNINGFIVKLNSNAEYIWSKSFVCNEISEIVELYVDNQDDIYFCGRFTGNLTLIDELNSNMNTVDVIFGKIDENANFSFVKSFGSDSFDSVFDIAFFDNKLYLSGMFQNSVDFDLSLESEFVLESLGSQNGYISVYDTLGNFDNVYGFTGIGYIAMKSLNFSNTNLYAIGNFENNMDTDPSENVNNLNSNGEEDIVLIKLSFDELNNLIENKKNNVTFFPNPSQNFENLKLINPDANYFIVKDLNGKTVFNSKLNLLNQSDIMQATYFLESYSIENRLLSTEKITISK